MILYLYAFKLISNGLILFIVAFKKKKYENHDKETKKIKIIWDFADSNHVPYDLQSYALPGELKSR